MPRANRRFLPGYLWHRQGSLILGFSAIGQMDSDGEGGSDEMFAISARACHRKRMARRAQVEYPGALYHVITRGNQGQRLFRDDRDREKYLVIRAILKNQFSFHISAYVLMMNLFGSANVPPSRIMQRLESCCGSGLIKS